MTPQESSVVDAFHDLYYNGPQGSDRLYLQTYWMGVLCQKCPLDLWIYQEILFAQRPDLIIETGTYSGGSALYLAHLCDILGKGRVVTVDIAPRPERPQHPRITYLTGSSTDPEIFNQATQGDAGSNVLVILDSDHSHRHVLDELRLYAPIVPPGGYLIVEDSNVNGHPTFPEHGPGPFEAIDDFLKETAAFEVDTTREKFMMTFNPRGYLRRRAEG